MSFFAHGGDLYGVPRRIRIEIHVFIAVHVSHEFFEHGLMCVGLTTEGQQYVFSNI